VRTRVITPITTKDFNPAAIHDLVSAARPDNEVTAVFIDHGPASIECEYDEALCVPDTIAQVCQAERESIDAVLINCMGDPGVKPAREAVAIPVLGPAETSMHLASSLAHRFSIVTVLERLIPLLENQAKVCGVWEKLASVRAVDIPVLELEKDRERLLAQLVDQSVHAIVHDGAHIIIFGCTGMAGLAQAVQERLAARGYPVPVIDPAIAALKVAEALVDMRLAHSKRTYPYPPRKRVDGYTALAGMVRQGEAEARFQGK